MGKTYRHRDRFDSDEDIVVVDLSQIHIPEKTWNNVVSQDPGQIDIMRADFESGRRMVRVVLRPRCGGGFNVEDGRHRVIAAKLAGIAHIEAVIVGS
jgi:hypothetical protein